MDYLSQAVYKFITSSLQMFDLLDRFNIKIRKRIGEEKTNLLCKDQKIDDSKNLNLSLDERIKYRRFSLYGGNIDATHPHACNLVRLYLHTDYKTMNAERLHIWTESYRKIQEFCYNNGLNFQLIDLNFNISQEMHFNSTNMKIYYQQIDYCKNFSFGPVFAVILGNKYGSSRFPELIPIEFYSTVEEFWNSSILENIFGSFNTWYKFDMNVSTPAYVRQVDYYNMDGLSEAEYMINQQKWNRVQQTMEEVILGDSFRCSKLMQQFFDKFCHVSELDHIVNYGVLHSNTPYCMTYHRDIINIRERLEVRTAPMFLDVLEINEERAIDSDKQSQLKTLIMKLDEHKNKLVTKNFRKYDAHVNWDDTWYASMGEVRNRQIFSDDHEISKNSWSFEIGRQNLGHETHIVERIGKMDEEKAYFSEDYKNYLDQLASDFVQDVTEQIDAKMKATNSDIYTIDLLEEEISQHCNIAKELNSQSEKPIREESIIKKLLDEIIEKRTIGKNLLLLAPQATGMATCVANIISNLKKWYGKETIVMFRFISRTSESCHLSTLLNSLIDQISIYFNFSTKFDHFSLSDKCHNNSNSKNFNNNLRNNDDQNVYSSMHLESQGINPFAYSSSLSKDIHYEYENNDEFSNFHKRKYDEIFSDDEKVSVNHSFNKTNCNISLNRVNCKQDIFVGNSQKVQKQVEIKNLNLLPSDFKMSNSYIKKDSIMKNPDIMKPNQRELLKYNLSKTYNNNILKSKFEGNVFLNNNDKISFNINSSNNLKNIQNRTSKLVEQKSFLQYNPRINHTNYNKSLLRIGNITKYSSDEHIKGFMNIGNFEKKKNKPDFIFLDTNQMNHKFFNSKASSSLINISTTFKDSKFEINKSKSLRNCNSRSFISKIKELDVFEKMEDLFEEDVETEIYNFLTLNKKKHLNITENFHNILEMAAKELSYDRQMFIVLNGLDWLRAEEGDAQCLDWLPIKRMPYIHFIVTASGTNEILARNLFNRFKPDEIHELVTPQENELYHAISRILEEKQRTITQDQLKFLLNLILPQVNFTYTRVLLNLAIRWNSDVIATKQLAPKALLGALSCMFKNLEMRISPIFVRNAVSYITIGWWGLTELELEDILSVDDDLLNDVYKYLTHVKINLIRCPQLFLARLRYELGSVLTTRISRGIPIFFWCSPSFAAIVKKYYLMEYESNEHNELFHHCCTVMTKIFSMTGNVLGNKRITLNREESTFSDYDRLVTPPSFLRRLLYLPYCIYYSEKEIITLKTYKTRIVCNVEWLLTKLKHCSIEQTLSDFRRVKNKDSDIKFVESIIVQCSSNLKHIPDLLCLEILARCSALPAVFQSSFISNMAVMANKKALMFDHLFMMPLYPCISNHNNKILAQIEGSMEIVEIFKKNILLTWCQFRGIFIYNMFDSYFMATYHWPVNISRNHIAANKNNLLFYMINKAFLIAYSVIDAKIAGSCYLLNKKRGYNIELKYLRTGFDIMSVEESARYMAIRINHNELRSKNNQLLIIDLQNMSIHSKYVVLPEKWVISNISFFDVSKEINLLFVVESNEVVLGEKNRYLMVVNNTGIIRTIGIFECNIIPIQPCFSKIASKIIMSHRKLNNKICIFDLLKLGSCIPHSSTYRNLSFAEINYFGQLFLIFTPDLEEKNSDKLTSLLLVMNEMHRENLLILKNGIVNCTCLSIDYFTLYIGYKNNGCIDVYDCLSKKIIHSLIVHEGDITFIKEVDLYQIVTTDLTGIKNINLQPVLTNQDYTQTIMDESTIMNDLKASTLATLYYSFYSEKVSFVSFGDRSYNTEMMMVFCFQSGTPVIVCAKKGFLVKQLELQDDIVSFEKLYYTPKYMLISGLVNIKMENNYQKSFIIWDAKTGKIKVRSTSTEFNHCIPGLNKFFFGLVRLDTNKIKCWVKISFKVVSSLTDMVIKETHIKYYCENRLFDHCFLSYDSRFIISVIVGSGIIIICALTDYTWNDSLDTTKFKKEPFNLTIFDDISINADTPEFIKKILDHKTPRNIYQFKFSVKNYKCVRLSYDNILIIGNKYGRIIFINLDALTNGVLILRHFQIFSPPLPISYLYLALNEKQLVMISKNRIKLFDIFMQECIFDQESEDLFDIATCVTISPMDGNLIVGWKSGRIIIYSLKTHKCEAQINVLKDVIHLHALKDLIIARVDSQDMNKIIFFRLVNQIIGKYNENF